jgi:hypothetical protein
MKLLMESTDHIVSLDGVECRVWNAVTETNIQCFVFVHLIAVRELEDRSEFAVLLERPEKEVKVLRNNVAEFFDE